jgi:hypothetical protein
MLKRIANRHMNNLIFIRNKVVSNKPLSKYIRLEQLYTRLFPDYDHVLRTAGAFMESTEVSLQIHMMLNTIKSTRQPYNLDKNKSLRLLIDLLSENPDSYKSFFVTMYKSIPEFDPINMTLQFKEENDFDKDDIVFLKEYFRSDEFYDELNIYSVLLGQNQERKLKGLIFTDKEKFKTEYYNLYVEVKSLMRLSYKFDRWLDILLNIELTNYIIKG